VNQQQNGGRWVRVGVYRMRAGDDYSIMFSRRTSGSDYVGADAVKVEKVSSVADSSEPPEDEDSTGSKGEDVVREAKGWNKVPYRLGGTSRSGVDCSGLTMRVYEKFGISLPRDVEKQYDYGSLVSGPPKAGDLVFFDEHGDGISHVGIATGKGTIIHASDHWKRVIETRIEYVEGYVGAKRLL
jgi:cell wall-associated NlpC family hydrolase